jgi:hypothetical protein
MSLNAREALVWIKARREGTMGRAQLAELRWAANRALLGVFSCQILLAAGGHSDSIHPELGRKACSNFPCLNSVKRSKICWCVKRI